MKNYPLFKIHVNSDLALAKIQEVFASGFINEGVQVTELTKELSKILETEQLALTNSGTSALTLALKLAGVGPGDEVISTPMTCVATNTPIANLGAHVVWADINPNHGMIDPQSIMAKVTHKTKAVMAVAWAGTPPDLSEIRKVCDDLKIPLILDAAHAFGARYKDKQIHEFADYTCYSFQAIKHFTTGDGGALISKSVQDYDRSKSLKWFGLDRDKAKDEKGDWKGQQWDVDGEEAGFKFNMNNVSAAIGLSQVPFIKKLLATHQANAAYYDQAFSSFEAVKPATRPKDTESSFWVYTMKIDPAKSSLSRDELLRILNAEGIMAGVVHVPNDAYTAFKSSQTDLPGVREFSSNQFSLPCGWWLKNEDLEHIAKRVKELTK